MESFIAHYEKHASYSDTGPSYEQLKLHHLHFIKLRMYGYDLTWLPVFVSNMCKIDTNIQNLNIFWQASWEELEMFMVLLPPSLTKPRTRSSNHPRTKLVFLLRGALIHAFAKFSILVIQS